MTDQRVGIAYGLTAYLLWGGLTAYWKLIHGVDAFELIGQRIVFALGLLGVIVVWRRAGASLRAAAADRVVRRRVLGAAALLLVNWTSYVWAIVHEHVVETALGYFICPLLTVAIGVVGLGERLRPAQTASMLVAAAAVVFLAVVYGQVPWIALAIAGSWAFYGLLKKQVPLGALESLTAETAVLLPLALVVLGIRLAAGSSAYQTVDARTIALLPLTGVVTVVPLLLFAAAARRLPLTVIGPVQYLVPTINFLLGVVAYGEEMTAERLTGFALVWLALVIFTADSLRASRRSPRPARLTEVSG
ncbi:MAG: EamA family transporter RarD [Acidimicrobiales bacterium]